MATAQWENDGEPNDEGQYVAVIDTEDGRGVQRFVGASFKDVADQLLEAQLNATTKIAELSPRNPATPAARPVAVATEKETDEQRDDREAQEAAAAAKQFAQSEEYAPYRSKANNMIIVRSMKRENLDPCQVENYFKIFRELKADALLDKVSAAPAPALEPAGQHQPDGSQPRRIDEGSTVRPRGQMRSTGLRNDDAGREPGLTPQSRNPKLTIADVEAMTEEQYAGKMEDPEFEKAVNQLYSGKPAAARA